jgi:hypothetical protein
MTPPKVIALEEHLTLAKLRALRGEKDTPVRKLDDLGELRIREMDEAGDRSAVISGNNPATQNLDAETAVELAVDLDVPLYIRRRTLRCRTPISRNIRRSPSPRLDLPQNHRRPSRRAAPFLLWRTDNILGERALMPRGFADYYREHF